MMEEVFRHFSGPSSALPAMVQILADFAASEGDHPISYYFPSEFLF